MERSPHDGSVALEKPRSSEGRFCVPALPSGEKKMPSLATGCLVFLLNMRKHIPLFSVLFLLDINGRCSERASIGTLAPQKRKTKTQASGFYGTQHHQVSSLLKRAIYGQVFICLLQPAAIALQGFLRMSRCLRNAGL